MLFDVRTISSGKVSRKICDLAKIGKLKNKPPTYIFSLFFNGLSGAPEKIRTPNLLIRSQMLYPVELRAPRTPEEVTNKQPRQGSAFYSVTTI